MIEYLITDGIFGEKLREIRIEKKLTQEEVAEALRNRGHSTIIRENISQVERGVRNIRVNVLRDLKDIYGLEHYDEFFEPPSPKSDSSKNRKSDNPDNQTIWKPSNASCIKKKS